MTHHWHANVTGDARKRLEAAEAPAQEPPFDLRPECWCGLRTLHLHAGSSPGTIMAAYPGYDPT